MEPERDRGSARRFPEGCSDAVPRRGRAPHLRRDDHRLALAPAGARRHLRRQAGPLDCSARRWPTASSVSALAGKREFMELGGLEHDRPRVFLLSTTHGGETHALAACRRRYGSTVDEPVTEHLPSTSALSLRAGIEATVVARHGLQAAGAGGGPALLPGLHHAGTPRGRPSQAFRSLFLQETIRSRPPGAFAGGQLQPTAPRRSPRRWRPSTARWRSIAGCWRTGSSTTCTAAPSKLVYRAYN